MEKRLPVSEQVARERERQALKYDRILRIDHPNRESQRLIAEQLSDNRSGQLRYDKLAPACIR